MDTWPLCSVNFATPPRYYVPPNKPPINTTTPPPCHATFSNGVIPWDGDWVGPNYAAAASTDRDTNISSLSPSSRTGWLYQPHDCTLQLYGTAEIQTVARRPDSPAKKIVILGSSIQRGVYLSLLDIMVDTPYKTDLAESVTAKCWGRASVQVGSIEAVYQDFRVDYMHAELAPDGQVIPMIECHGDKVALGPGLSTNATVLFKTMFAPTEHWPDVLYMASSSFANLDAALMKEFVALIPSSWTGKLFLGYGRFNGLWDIYKESEFQEAKANAQYLRDYLKNDTRIHFLDQAHLVSAMRLQTETVGKLAGSQHFHRFCREGDLFVCSNVTETVAQLLLGAALLVGPTANGKAAPMIRSTAVPAVANDNSTNITSLMPRICTDCPAGLLPFHIKPVPDLTCHDGPYVAASSAGAAWSDLCPASCLSTPPNGTTWTQSGPVDVRHCPMDDR